MRWGGACNSLPHEAEAYGRQYKRKTARKPAADKREEDYRHPEAETPLRPEIGTQAQFRKKKPPATYRYDCSLAPALDWDGKNPAREQGEAAIREILEAAAIDAAKRQWGKRQWGKRQWASANGGQSENREGLHDRPFR